MTHGFRCLLALVLSARALMGVGAETHIVFFDNRCNRGTPMLRSQGQTYSTGETVVFDGPFSGTAFLQNGHCGPNGEGCTLVQLTLSNSGSSANVSLVWPNVFSVTTGFGFFGGTFCNGAGFDCTDPDCCCSNTGISDTVTCPEPDMDIAVTFCD